MRNNEQWLRVGSGVFLTAITVTLGLVALGGNNDSVAANDTERAVNQVTQDDSRPSPPSNAMQAVSNGQAPGAPVKQVSPQSPATQQPEAPTAQGVAAKVQQSKHSAVTPAPVPPLVAGKAPVAVQPASSSPPPSAVASTAVPSISTGREPATVGQLAEACERGLGAMSATAAIDAATRKDQQICKSYVSGAFDALLLAQVHQGCQNRVYGLTARDYVVSFLNWARRQKADAAILKQPRAVGVGMAFLEMHPCVKP